MKLFGLLAAMLAITPLAHATVITTGLIEVTPQTGGFKFDLMLDGISANGRADYGSRYLRPGYEGETFNGNHDNTQATDMFAGAVAGVGVEWRIGNDPFPTHFREYAPGAELTRGLTLYRTSFDFEGQLCGTRYQQYTCFLAFPNLTGQGMAEFLFDETVLDDGRHYFTPMKATYTFMPVPEPATHALFSIGIAGLGFARRRRVR